MMSGQLILSGKTFKHIFHGIVKNITIASDPHSPFQYHQGSYYINPCYHAWHAFVLSRVSHHFSPWPIAIKIGPSCPKKVVRFVFKQWSELSLKSGYS